MARELAYFAKRGNEVSQQVPPLVDGSSVAFDFGGTKNS